MKPQLEDACMNTPLPTLVKLARALEFDMSQLQSLPKDDKVRRQWLCERICPATFVTDETLRFLGPDDCKGKQRHAMLVKLHPDKNRGCPDESTRKFRDYTDRCNSNDFQGNYERDSLSKQLWEAVGHYYEWSDDINVMYERIDNLKNLIKKGADVNHRHQDMTVLYHTIFNGNFEFISLLIIKGADINALSQTHYGGYTPLALAIDRGEISSIEFLLKRGAKFQAGLTPLGMYATSPGFWGRPSWAEDGFKILDMLKKYYGEDFLAMTIDEEGRTPLRNAITGHDKSPDLVIYLLKSGVDPSVRAKDGLTVLDILKRIDEENFPTYWSEREKQVHRQLMEILTQPYMQSQMDASDERLAQVLSQAPKDVRTFVTWQSQFLKVCDDIKTGAMPKAELRAFARILGIDNPSDYTTKRELCDTVYLTMAEKIPSMFRK